MTEKNYNPKQKEKKAMKKQEVVRDLKPKKQEKPAEKKVKEEKSEKKEPIIKKEKRKKEEAVVKSYNLPISTKYSVALCKFVKGKTPRIAIEDMEKVIAKKKAVPMKGEIPHRKGKRIMSGRYPKRATEYFIRLVKSLQANAVANSIENPVIIEAISNRASRPFGRYNRFGAIQRKRTHVELKAMEKIKWKKEK